MARYYFDIYDTKFSSIDEDGQECADKDAVGLEALRQLCVIAKDDPLHHMQSKLGAIVRDGNNHVVLTANINLTITWVGEA